MGTGELKRWQAEALVSLQFVVSLAIRGESGNSWWASAFR